MSASTQAASNPIVPAANVSRFGDMRAARLQTLEAVRSAAGSFDPDAWHVIEERDSALISDELLHGAGSSKFVYRFPGSDGKEHSGVSVIGARHLASAYGGLKHRLVASVQKVGALHTFTSYPMPGMPMNVQTAVIYELEAEPDYFEAIIEIVDVKSGNSIQIQKREARWDTTKTGVKYEKIHYATIAQAKAYRNGILSVIPQDVQIRWKLQQLQLHKDDVITASLMEQKRDGVLRFASAKGIGVDRHVVEALTIEQISGLSDAARAGKEDFLASARSLGVMGEAAPTVAASAPAPAKGKAALAPQARTDSRGDAGKPQAQVLPSFRHYLVDGTGEVCSDLLTDAGAWSEQFVKLWLPDEEARPALFENNADALRDARGIPEARELLPADLSEVATRIARDERTHIDAPREIPLPRGNRGPDIAAWIKLAREAVGPLGAEDMQEWIGNNQQVWKAFPASRRLEVDKLVGERCNALGLKWTPPGAPQEQPHLGNPVAWANDQLAQLARCESDEDAASLAERIRVRLDAARERDPEAVQALDQALSERVPMRPANAPKPEGPAANAARFGDAAEKGA